MHMHTHTPMASPSHQPNPRPTAQAKTRRLLGLGIKLQQLVPFVGALLGVCLSPLAIAQKTSSNFLLYSIAGTTGLGLGVAKEMKNGLILRAELTDMLKSIQTSQDGIDYKGKIELASAALYADWHPFDSVFHISTGLNIKPTNVSLAATTSNGIITLNGQAYPLSGSQGLNANISFPTFMPYLGLGWGFEHVATYTGFSFNTDLGFDFGKMNANLSPTPGLTSLPGFNDNLNAQSQKLNASVSGIRFFPVVKFQLGYAY